MTPNGGGRMPPSSNSEEKKIIPGVKVVQLSTKQKLRKAIIADDITDIKEFLVYKVLIPTMKQSVSDMILRAVNGIFGTGTTGTVVRTIANQLISVNPSQTRIAYEKGSAATMVNLPQSPCNYDGFMFPTIESIESVMFELRAILEEYNKVRISDLYEKCGITPPPTANNYGWRDLRGMDKVLMGDGRYLLRLPAAIQL